MNSATQSSVKKNKYQELHSKLSQTRKGIVAYGGGDFNMKIGPTVGLTNHWFLRRFDILPVFKESLRESVY
ncbi:hypothetical protein BELL_0217g00050 [Botrytis elliptica]|uniref:Uncharacterized protein n=1 Tax=Botrytis elliptica TaxID=278938 RepID=A0A4Z1JNJ9_9HELO|nr:hypothetical protein BELL_0217g00050 [Botrytis elliptica]